MEESGESERVPTGGLVDETLVTLAVYGEDLDPDDISRTLGPKQATGGGREPNDASVVRLEI